MSESIKAFVERRWKDGLRPYIVWQEAQKQFPHACCAWSYVNGVCRRLQLERARQITKEGEYNCQSRD